MTANTGDQFNVTADQLNLGALANNGGLTQTHALFGPSVAIDSGDDCVADSLHCSDPNLPQLQFDQRGTGFSRKVGPHVDAGAFEVQPTVVFTVNRTDDHDDGTCAASPGDCTLREAINAANADPDANQINFVPGTINLAAALPDISRNVTISGPGPNWVTVRRSPTNLGIPFRIFNVTATGAVTISGLTITNGNLQGDGGGISNTGAGGVAGTLYVSNCILNDNHASDGRGGAIANALNGTLYITNSTISNNQSGGGGGLANLNPAGFIYILDSTISGNRAQDRSSSFSGGIENNGRLVITNSTISDNHASADGGGIFNGSGGTLNLTSSTLANNTAAIGGGIFNSNSSSASVNLRSSIIAQNTASSSGPDLSGTFNSNGHNVIGDISTATITANTGDQFGVTETQLNLGALDNNGGSTKTRALFLPSVAIDAGDDCVADGFYCFDSNLPQLLYDQREAGFPRKVGDHVDVGAFEVQSSATPTPTPSPTPMATPSPTPCTGSNRLQDPSLEASSGNGPITNPKWESTSTKFGSSLCSSAVCGNGSNGQAKPRNGTYWAWFGGADGPENGTLKQTVIIPTGGPAQLNYYLKVSRVYAHGDVLRVKIDGNTIETVPEPEVPDPAYLLHSVDLADFADGGSHTILFEFSGQGLGRTSSFNVDDITLDVPCPGASPTPTPSPSPTPTPTPCEGGNKAKDSSLESSTGNNFPITNPNWESTSTHFASSLCSSAVCGNGSNGQALPRTGKFWAWFGGSEGPEDGTLKQKVVIPSGAVMFIGFYLKISKVYAPFADTLTITVDGEAIDTITEPSTEESTYTFHASPVPASFADGGLHTIGFGFDAPNMGKVSSFNVDDITFDVTCPPVSPGGGSESVQFNGANYVIREGAGTADLTVTRTGDASNSVTVNFSTNDDGGTQPCSAMTGVASPRCDYMATTGTLKFAPGETSKTISVPITDDAYLEGSESFAVTLGNPVGAVLGTQASTTVNIADNRAAATAANPLDSSTAQFFVRQHYLDFLNREPDASGWDFWMKQITGCGFDFRCIEERRVNVSAAYFLAIEFQQTGYLVERMYKTAYGNLPNAPVPIKFNEFLADTQKIGDGLIVGKSGWEGTLENNKQAFAAAFVQRSRFSSAYPTSMTAAKFVDQLNTNAGNVLSPAERATALALFGNSGDTSNIAARAQALRQVAENQNLYKTEFNRAFVLMQYFGYLRRDPNSGQDSDFGGYSFWLKKLNDSQR